MSPLDLLEVAHASRANVANVANAANVAIARELILSWQVGRTGELTLEATLADNGDAHIELHARIDDERVFDRNSQQRTSTQHSLRGSWTATRSHASDVLICEWRIEAATPHGLISIQLIDRGDATRPVLLTNAPASIGLLGGTYALTKLTTPAH